LLDEFSGRHRHRSPRRDLEEVALLRRARFACRALRTGNIMVADGRPRLIDMDFAEESASPRLQAIDRAELLASLAAIVGRADVASARRTLTPSDLAAATPFCSRCLSAAARKRASKAMLGELRSEIARS
jgi:hypothetical protein